MDDGYAAAPIRAALGLLLEPVILLLLKSRVTWKEFSAIARQRFVRVATREFGIRGRPTNVSRVAILTGMDRRDVRKLRAESANSDLPLQGFVSKPTLVLEGWYRDREFLTENGKPRELKIEGERNSFAVLVRRYAPGIPVVAMIKELRAAGAVERTEDEKVRALKRTYIPRAVSENQIRLWGSVLHDIGTTLEINVSRTATELPRFERRALSLEVDRKALPEFREFLEAEGQAFLERVDAWLEAHRVPAGAREVRGLRLGVGVYHIEDAVGGVRRRR